MDITLNWAAIGLLTVIHFSLGALWFGPLFGKIWMRIHHGDKKIPDEEMKKMMEGMWKLMLTEFIACGLMVIALACLVGAIPTMSGWQIGLMTWVGFVLPMSASNVIWGTDSREWMVTKIALVTGYRLIAFIAIGYILSIWH
ncbi:DUF1761 domain-containing protein [Candidatus Gracilibacteria bacterium]|nr:DUF1761 domain-containing protein [Candidatus Gracilibacteria bacterium]